MRKLPVIILASALVVLVAGCGGSASAHSTSAAPTATLVPTATPTATPIPTAPAGAFTACFHGNPSLQAPALQYGDLVISQLAMGGLSYPSVALPNTASPSAPFEVHGDGPATYAVDFPNSPVVNPSLTDHAGGFEIGVCNVSSTQAHVLQSVSAKLVSVTPYAGQLNEWMACDGVIDSHHQPTGGGCGGAIADCACFHAVFPDGAPAGTEVTMSQTGFALNNPGDGLAKLPLSLAPGTSVTLFLGMDKFKAATTYTLGFGFAFDGAPPMYAPTSPPILLAPNAHAWGALNCLKQPSLLAQITPTNPETYYICA